MDVFGILDNVIADLNKVSTVGKDSLIALATSIIKLEELRKGIKVVEEKKQEEEANG